MVRAKDRPNYRKNKEIIQRLFREYAESRDPVIRDELIRRNLYIAEILAKKYANKGIEYEDIYQVASLGLIYAIDRYDLTKGFEFSSFATPTIIGEIKKYFRDKGWSIRVPRRIQELSKKINNAKLDLGQKLHRPPTVQDISEYLGVPEESILEAMEASNVYNLHSLESSFDSDSEDKDLNLSLFLGEDDRNYQRFENQDFLLRAMEKLTEIEKTILKERYIQQKTQVRIAEDLGMSQMTVSRLEKRIIAKFRKELMRTEN